jgi:hypothetical protein
MDATLGAAQPSRLCSARTWQRRCAHGGVDTSEVCCDRDSHRQGLLAVGESSLRVEQELANGSVRTAGIAAATDLGISNVSRNLIRFQRPVALVPRVYDNSNTR